MAPHLPAYLREEFCEVLKQVGAVKVTVVVEVELGDEARDPPQLHDRLQGQLPHLVCDPRVVRRDDLTQTCQVHLPVENKKKVESLSEF